MKTFRRWLITMAVGLFAFALGTALGAGPLHGPGQVLPGVPDEAPSNAAVAAFESSFVAKTSGDLMRGKLDGRRVVVLRLAGADTEQVQRVRSALRAAGARVTTRTLTAKLTDAANRQFADGVAKQSAGEAAGTSGDAYRRIGAALARALVSKSGGTPDAQAQTIWSAFAQGGFVGGDLPTRYSEAVVFVAGGKRLAAPSSVAARLAAAFEPAAAGVVVAGPSSSSLVNGVVAMVRTKVKGVSTVDVLDSSAGGLLVPLVLRKDLKGKPGAWGTPRSASGAVPKL